MRSIIKKIDIFLNSKHIFNRPLSLWVVLSVFIVWSVANAADYILYIFGVATAPDIIASTVIIPINLYCIAGLWKYKRKTLETAKYWLWLSYVLAVFLFPEYVSIFSEERSNVRLMMAIIMSPVLAAWIILRFSSLKLMFTKDEEKISG